MVVECIGSLDQGTQSSRFFLYDVKGAVIASAQQEFPQYCPQAGWIEHDPEEIWGSVLGVMQQAFTAATSALGEPPVVKGLGITNQRETIIMWDKYTGRPLYPAIVWSDARAASISDRMTESFGAVGSEFFRSITGLPVNSYFSAYKLRWLLENVSEVAQAARDSSALFGTVDAFLIWRLTGGVDGGVHVTDVTNASRTNLMHLSEQRWHEPTMERFGATAAMLPRICSSAEVYGQVKSGPLQGVPISGCLGDQMAALLGQRCRPQEAKATYGTGCFVLMHTGCQPVTSEHRLLTTVAYKLGPSAKTQYALEGSIAVAGAGITWLRDGLGLLDSVAQSEELAATVPDTGGVYLVPAFEGLLAPRWRSDARGAVLGLTSMSTKAHVVRAMLEAISFQTREVCTAMCRDACIPRLEALRADGGASANNLLMQLQADLMQVVVERPAHRETTALGAAFAAGIAVGFWTEDSIFSAGFSEQKVDRFEPQISPEAAAGRLAKWELAVEASYGLSALSG